MKLLLATILILMTAYTFLENYDFAGKHVVLFSTHEDSGLGNTVQNIETALSTAKVQQGFTIRGAVAQNNHDEAQSIVIQWLGQNGYAKKCWNKEC